eukprot:TRINITY_DN42604_c0_g1_i1.p1 TRINITY_DN42604_c0_g1~~TRINITY_DN42604_c0_g1_i1.p1  ORF type:complete len:365 (+),score=76.41 TRINITY_DN42604_c0_g1_i1:97-1095(+)
MALGTNSRSIVLCEVPNDSEFEYCQGKLDSLLQLKQLGCREKLHAGSVYCLAWDAPRGAAATGSNDQSVRLFQLPPGNPHQHPNASSPSAASEGRLMLRAGAVRGVAFLRSGGGVVGQPVLAAASDQQVQTKSKASVRLWDAETQAELPALESLTEPAAALSTPTGAEGEPLGPLCAAGGSTCAVWDLRSSAEAAAIKLSAPSGCRLASVAASTSSGGAAPLVAAGGQNGQVFVWDLRRGGSPCATWSPHQEAVRAVALDPSRRYLANASMDGTLSICDLWLANDPPRVLHGHESHAVSALWHPTRPLLLSTSADGVALLWAATASGADFEQ